MLAFAATLLLASSCADKPGVTRAVNPLTYTDIPDNDLIRVGDSYYMVSTTMYFCPVAPIMKSKDLVHWQIVNYVCDLIEDDDVYNLRNGRNAYGKGQWATSLRYVDGTYYALFIANDQPDKTYVYKTDDIENGKWTKTELEGKFHDASMLFDNDGRLYILWGNGDLHLTELEPDASAVKKDGIDSVIIESPREGYSLRAEGVHFYHIDDYYYVLEIDWPSGGVRTETCWRSKNILGPYESKVVLSGAFDGRKDGVAQGGIVQTQYGDWYAIMFQDHGAVGRIPTVQPVTWVDGWPMMGDNGTPVKEFDVNLTPWGDDYVWDSDEFDSGTLALVWQWNHKPVADRWSLSERPGWMRLKTCNVVPGIASARNTLTQRTVGPCSSSSVKLDASGLKPGDRAGICAFQSNCATVGVEVAEDGSKALVVRENSNGMKRGMKDGKPYFERYAEDKVICSEALESENVWLRIDYTFTPSSLDLSEPDTATFSWSYDGENWKTSDYTLHMRYTLDYFTGYRTALYCYPTIAEGGYADFDWFRQQVTE